MKNAVVLGALFGDEGKGATVQWLCRQAIDTVGKSNVEVTKLNGGSQAGHTIMNNTTTHICSSIGAGCLLDVPTFYNYNFIMDPICLVKELLTLNKAGYYPKIYLNSSNMVTTPYDVWFNQHDEDTIADGTCGKGINATYTRYINPKTGTIYPGISWPSLREALTNPEEYLELVSNYYTKVDTSFNDMFIKACEALRRNNNVRFLSYPSYKFNIYEGAQGLLLDKDRGFNPNTTPSNTGLLNISPAKLYDGLDVYLVCRTYLTRHGNGYIPKPFSRGNEPVITNETNVTNQWQGDFKIGVMDFDLLNRAIDRHCLDNYPNIRYHIVVTHIDSFVDKCSFYEYRYDKRHNYTGATLDSIMRVFKESIHLPITNWYYSDNPYSIIKKWN